MFLRGLRIENFRAIRKTDISLDDGTSLIGENDCGISSVLDALELVLGHEHKKQAIPPWLFHRDNSGEPAGKIRIRLMFRERYRGEWDGNEYSAFESFLAGYPKRPRELWYETTITSGEEGKDARVEHRLRSPGVKGTTSDKKIVGRLRRMNPLIRVSAGMMTGHGRSAEWFEHGDDPALKISPVVRDLATRINRAVETRLTGKSMNLAADLEDGYDAAYKLLETGSIKLGKWETGLTRSVGEIIGWHADAGAPESGPMHNPDGNQQRLGILLLIGALLRARPGGLAPDADPLWVIEEPEAHLHPITLSSVATLVSLIQRQKIITTYSGDLLSIVPLRQVRRLVRYDGELIERRVKQAVLSRSEQRRFHYHVRSRFSVASFSRMWLLVEGESEFWILPQLASLMGYDFQLEGIACIEFAQCGLDPPLKVARELGIEWHLLSDGDDAGQAYSNAALNYIEEGEKEERMTVLHESDIERFFWEFGYDHVYRKAAKLPERELAHMSPARVIRAAVRRHSKPHLALAVVEAVAGKDSPGIPPVLQAMIETCVDLARRAPERLVSGGS